MSRHSMVLPLHTMRRVTAIALTVLLLIQTTGCQTWRPATRPLPTLESAKSTGKYRFTLASGEQFLLTAVRTHGDSVVGLAEPMKVVHGERDKWWVENVPVSRGFPLAEVTGIERQTQDLGKIGGLILAVVALSGLAALAFPPDYGIGGWN